MTPHVSRRQFLATAGTVAGLTVAAPAAWARKAVRPARKRIALIATEVRLHSHAQHFIDRFLVVDGLLARQEVWNDLAEHRSAAAAPRA